LLFINSSEKSTKLIFSQKPAFAGAGHTLFFYY